MSADEFNDKSKTPGSQNAPIVPLGSALLFNGKINHRGTSNASQRDRPAIYTVYHKLWYNDQYRKGVE